MNLPQYLLFLEEAEGLKSVERTAWTSKGRRESTAEHSWRLALLAALLSRAYPHLDLGRLLLLCLIHDMGELYSGDISAATLPDQAGKYEEELRGVQQAFSLLPDLQREELLELWQDYSSGRTEEARLVKALDKAETILQHCQGGNPPDFDYGFNLTYGAEYFEADPLLRSLRQLLDEKTRRRMEQP